MSATPIYLLAKYIPDLERFEPLNVGVIVWSPEGVEGRFVAEKAGQPGEVDGRSVPGFITSLSAYKQWVKYWRTALEQVEYAPPSGGAKVSRGVPGFMEALKASGRGNFLLAEGGVLLDDVPAEELPHVVGQLFDRLVESGLPEEPRDLTLEEVCGELLEKSKLVQHPHFRARYPVKCPLNGVEEEYVFTYGLGNGKPERLLQRFPMPKRKADMRKNTHDTAWAFEKVEQAGIVTPAQTAALVFLSDEQLAEPEVSRAVRVLGSVTNVFNLNDQAKTLAMFNELANLPGQRGEVVGP
jgi:hypothetical protein